MVTETSAAAFASRLMLHTYNGLCPDSIEGWETRDPECSACKALDEFVAMRDEARHVPLLVATLDETIRERDAAFTFLTEAQCEAAMENAKERSHGAHSEKHPDELDAIRRAAHDESVANCAPRVQHITNDGISTLCGQPCPTDVSPAGTPWCVECTERDH